MSPMMRRAPLLLLLLGMLTLLAACERGQPTGVEPEGPSVTIESPANNARVATGTEVNIVSTARDEKQRVVQIDLVVNGELVSESVTPSADGQAIFSTVQRWVPVAPGPARVEVIGRNAAGLAGPPAVVLLDVVGPGFSTASPTPIPPTPTVTSDPPPQPPAATATLTPVPPPPPPNQITGRVTANLGINVRSGPGVAFQRIGGVNLNETVTAIARNTAGDWAKVRFGPANTEGWLAAQFVEWSADIQSLPTE